MVTLGVDAHKRGPLTAAKLLGEVGDIGRFRSRAAFAMHTGTAPTPARRPSHAGELRESARGRRLT